MLLPSNEYILYMWYVFYGKKNEDLYHHYKAQFPQIIAQYICAMVQQHTVCPKKSEPPKHFAITAANLHRFT